ncbi:probable staphylococcal-like nuclease CAN1 [Zingiber officinale]|uniref:probable staphylococcal-like nuclease CAN1 n=1 Tax=Zingiber officinale TaxID=94328 RepID=UPI001C4DADAD|nr:probable staphylococcal-like nuclease CAN1 [Zingiber officinale]
MGNSLFKFLCGKFSDQPHHSSAAPPAAPDAVSALAHDLHHFGVTSQVPERLSHHVVSSKKAQANWYRKLLDAWNESKPPPKTPEAASRLVVQTLKRHQRADVEGLLAYYGLPLPHTLPDAAPVVRPSSKPEGVKYELHMLPSMHLGSLVTKCLILSVDARVVADGDTITVYVDTADPRESANVPRGVHEVAIERARARAAKDYNKADALHKIVMDAGYKVIAGANDEEILAQVSNQTKVQHLVHLALINRPNNDNRGIDAPESSMPFGKEAKKALVKLVQENLY